MRSDVDFEALVREHHAALYRFARSMTRNDADAQDLVQDTFLKWAERGHQLADVSKVKSWLFTTLYREASARRRRLTRFPHGDLEQLESELPEVPPSAGVGTDATLVIEALNRVDDTFRGALALFYLEDYTYPEIASLLEIPVGTVKSRIARGIAQMQRILGAHRRGPASPPAP